VGEKVFPGAGVCLKGESEWTFWKPGKNSPSQDRSERVEGDRNVKNKSIRSLAKKRKQSTSGDWKRESTKLLQPKHT